MKPRKFRTLSAITAGSLTLAAVAITASSGTSQTATHAALAARTESFPPVNSTGTPPGQLNPGQRITSGTQIASPDGRFVLQMQSDGNLVLRAPGNIPLGDTHTAGHDGTIAVMQTDGNFVLRAPGNIPVWASGTDGHPGTVLQVQDDGAVVLYAPGHQVLRVIFPASPGPRGSVPTPAVPPATAGDLVCTRSGPGGLTDDWVYTAQITASEGLAVKDVRFGPRYVARKISVPYIRPVGFGSGTGHLTVTPDTSDPDLRSTLLKVDCNANGHPGVSATYSVSSLSTNLTFLVQQSYRFDPFNTKERCEATETTNCVRFWPTVTWALPGARVPDPAYGLNIIQRFEFDPDQYDPAQPGHGAADVIADEPAPGNRGVDDLGSGGSLKREDAIKAITEGKTAYWEDWHQTDRDSVGLPGISIPKLVRGSAGCSECVHAHWSWFANLPSQARNNWSDGKPEILDGSKQTDCIGWVKSTTVVPETNWCDRAGNKNHRGAAVDPATDRLVMYWDARTTADGSPSSGVSINGADFAVGDSYWPQLDQVETQHADGTWPHGGNGSMFIVPARRLLTVTKPRANTEASITPLYGAVTRGFSGPRLPAGWVLPVRISLGNNSDQGLYFLRVKSTSARLLNPAPLYSPAGGGAPWVLVYNDTLGPDGVTWHLSSGPPLAYYNGRQGYMLALVVFEQKPTAADTSFELDAAPDGVGGYLPSTGNW